MSRRKKGRFFGMNMAEEKTAKPEAEAGFVNPFSVDGSRSAKPWYEFFCSKCEALNITDSGKCDDCGEPMPEPEAASSE